MSLADDVLIQRLAPPGAVFDLSGEKAKSYTVATALACYRVTVVTRDAQANRIEIGISPIRTSMCSLYVTLTDFETRLEDVQRMIDYAVVAPIDTCVKVKKLEDECDCEQLPKMQSEIASLTKFAHDLAQEFTTQHTAMVLHSHTYNPSAHIFTILHQNKVFQFTASYIGAINLYAIVLGRKRHGITKLCVSESHLDFGKLAKTLLFLLKQPVDMEKHVTISFCSICFRRFRNAD